MDREWYWRGGFIALVTLGTLYLLLPSYYYFQLDPKDRNNKAALEEKLPSWVPNKNVNLGLDLQGGVHLVMKVGIDAALTAKAANRGTEIEDYLKTKQIEGVTSAVVDRNKVKLTIPEASLDKALPFIAEFDDMEQSSKDGSVLVYSFRPETITNLKDGAIEQSVRAIRNRVDKFGVAEPIIARRGEEHILVQLPGFDNPEEAAKLIGRTAKLEFRMVVDGDRTVQNMSDVPAGATQEFDGTDTFLQWTDPQKTQALLTYANSKKPEGKVFILGRTDEPGEETKFRTWLVDEKIALDGSYLTNATIQLGDDALDNRPYVSLTFNRTGAKKFEDLTGANIGKRMAIVLEETVNSAPVIQDKISGGSARITLGGYKSVDESMQEASELASVLRAGALPAPLTTGETRAVGASLGPELIERGTMALLIGTLLVILFMLVYYRLTGLIADVALVLNGLLIFAALGLFGASLTLPGIAGVVLTLGMAVDANVIINERIREELKAGKSPRAAVGVGYDKAFTAILDANLTTVLAGIVLLQYGTGPIKGFAVTLIIGILASMFTAIVVTRWLMDLVVAKRPEQLSI